MSITAQAYIRELQRDSKHESAVQDLVSMVVEEGTPAGRGLRWVWQ